MRRNNNSKNRISSSHEIGTTATLSEKAMGKIRKLNSDVADAVRALGNLTAQYEEAKTTLITKLKASQAENSKALKAEALTQHGINLDVPEQRWNLDLTTGTLSRVQ